MISTIKYGETVAKKNKKTTRDDKQSETDELMEGLFPGDDKEAPETKENVPEDDGDTGVPDLFAEDEEEEETPGKDKAKEEASEEKPAVVEEPKKVLPPPRSPGEFDDEEEAAEANRLKIFAVTTPIGQERAAADSMIPRINPARQGIISLLCPTKLRGFILVEAFDVRELKRIVKGVPKVRRVVEGERETTLDEIEKFLTPKPVLEGIRPGNIVELVSGPFKGEKAKVQHVDNDKEEITVELFEAMVPIPVTVKGEHVRLIVEK